MQGTSIFFQALPEGKYQLLLHKGTSYEIPASTLRIRVTGFGLENKIEGAYYEPMYLDDSVIATCTFWVQSPCKVLVSFSHVPAGLESVQLKSIEQKGVTNVTPQWQRPGRLSDQVQLDTLTPTICPVGHWWICSRLQYDLKPQLGRMGKNLAMHAGVGASKHQYRDPVHASGVDVFPSVLVNVKDYTWRKTSLHELRETALLDSGVQLVHHQSLAMFGVALYFSGWIYDDDLAAFGVKPRAKRPTLMPGHLQYDKHTGSLNLIFTWLNHASSLMQPQLEHFPFWLLCH